MGTGRGYKANYLTHSINDTNIYNQNYNKLDELQNIIKHKYHLFDNHHRHHYTKRFTGTKSINQKKHSKRPCLVLYFFI